MSIALVKISLTQPISCSNLTIETLEQDVKCSNSIIKTPKRRHLSHSSAFINFENILHLVLVFLLLTMSRQIQARQLPFNVRFERTLRETKRKIGILWIPKATEKQSLKYTCKDKSYFQRHVKLILNSKPSETTFQEVCIVLSNFYTRATE